MRLPISLLLLSTLACAQDGWERTLSAVGLKGRVVVATGGTGWQARAERGEFIVFEGASVGAAELGFRAEDRKISVRSIVDQHAPRLPIIWEQSSIVPVFSVPAGAHVFARERWTEAPVLAGIRTGQGAVLWMATKLGDKGYERFPYALQALYDLGLRPDYESRRLWAFFDSSYRLRVDPDYLARRWRQGGVAALQVASWHYNEPDPIRDAYLTKLIEACHRNAILVYAWVELPHVSEKFWNDHPEWREQTAAGQDAHLDWRKLMNLQNRDCFRAASAAIRQLMERFDWDGINLAELYFESLEGEANPARFTPMNRDVRAAYEKATGIDPALLFGAKSHAGMQDFLVWRADLAGAMQAEWILEVEQLRRTRPDLDLVLTHVDDRFDPQMRDLIGADAARALNLLDTFPLTFLIEDPATLWHLGPERYSELAERYRPLTKRQEQLAIDINVVERYQDVYPTKQQTGSELFQLVHLSSKAFPRVALYFENSILNPDWSLLPSAGAVVASDVQRAEKRMITAAHTTGLRTTQSWEVNGKLWPAKNDELLWLPAGSHTLKAAPAAAVPIRLLDLNGELKHAAVVPQGIEFSYSNNARAIAKLDKPAASVQIDGLSTTLSGTLLTLPKGQHTVTVHVR